MFKIKVFLLALCLSSLCLGQDISPIEYSDLVAAVKEAKFAKFKNLYSEKTLSIAQKNALLAEANKVITHSEKNYPAAWVGALWKKMVER